MYQAIPGGTTQRIGFDESEFIDVQLPPVGYVIDKIPDPKTGRPSENLIRSEILFTDVPLVDRKWKRTPLPKNWNKLLEEESIAQLTNADFTHPDCDHFRAQEWRRRVNGVWIALGNRDNKPVEHVYLTGTAYLYFNWWEVDFIPKFRHVYLRVFYALAYVEENPMCYGLALSTLRRFGKTAMAFCWYYDYTSRRKNSYSGFQAKKDKDAKLKFKINVVGPWRRLPEFFRPEFDTQGTQVSSIDFIRTANKGERSTDNFTEDTSLHSILDYRDSSETAYDQAKLNRYCMEEPGKWEESNVYETFRKVQPALKDGSKIIGKCFAPTTVEELEKGGDSFIELFEDSFPTLTDKNGGITKSGLLALFIPAFDGYVFDEYGRSVVDDPDPKQKIFDEDGNVIKEGAKTLLLRDRKVKESDLLALTSLMRKYPWSWDEAKSVANEFCHFNHQLLSKRLTQLEAGQPKFVLGNFDWLDKKDGEVEFFRDDHKGRWKIAWLPDVDGDGGEATNAYKIANNVRAEWDTDNERWLFFPMNDHLFASGVDPIRNIQTDDPKASKAAYYVFRKYSALIDAGKPEQKPGLPIEQQFVTHRFIVEYLVRPDDPEVFHEDMIKSCRYWGVSMFEEGNIETLRQHFVTRGYAGFLVNRGHFTDEALPGVKKDGNYADKAVRTDDVVTHNLVDTLKMYYNRYIDLVDFPELISSSLKFRIKKHFKKDAVFGAGYTLISASRSIAPPDPNENTIPIELEINPLYDQSGNQSREVELNELTWQN